jgi:hypothetical protein
MMGLLAHTAVDEQGRSRTSVRVAWPFGERVQTVTLVAIGLLAVLNGADVVTTHLLLAHAAVEANPLSSFLLANQSLLWIKLALLALLGLKVVYSRPRLGVMAVACFAAGIYATAVLSNLLVLHLAAN